MQSNNGLLPKVVACDCVCVPCRLNMDVANLDGTSVAAALQTQIKAQLMEVTKQRTEVQHLQL